MEQMDDPKENQWECSVDDKRVGDFQEYLWKRYDDNWYWQHKSFSGLRRFEEEGIGQSGKAKKGWWWVMNVRNDFSPTEFVQNYISFWCRDDKEKCRERPVYIETTNGSGSHTSADGESEQ